ncbi:FAD-dependent oxidoreductase [Amycolatopsis antarctica]|uniref:FAD-dependent oxidoreductase n=1 Tax=Amycolatopsis antarctica TaxID=1854586 RepID=A0A263D8I1_9PSEU|nr:FAD-dependent oxidoreductase [Amycolatopsis antarctica]OZM74812.1 FAD-dependent oxidoreductase [Amycolatopsis antarctica]
MNTPAHIVVAGAGAAGLGTAEALRRKGYRGELTVIGAETHPPYDRPPLSKQVLSGAWEPIRCHLRSPEALSTTDAEFVLGDPAARLDAVARTVHTSSGRVLRGDAVVIATGLRPRMLPGQSALAGVHSLRTLDDAMALRTDLLTASRLVVVGEGVLGAEIAATARGMGVDVTVAGPQSAPMLGQLGPAAAKLLALLHNENGVRLRLGTGVAGLVGADGRVTGVRTDSGELLPADVVVVAIGADPVTEWLAGSGLTLDDGVVCDLRCRAAEGVYAVGDVARVRDERSGVTRRLENRTNATEQAGAAADAILDIERPGRPLSYFWTEQFGTRIHVYGALPADAKVSIVDGDPTAGRFVAEYHRAGEVTGVLGWNMPKQARIRGQRIAAAESGLAPDEPAALAAPP